MNAPTLKSSYIGLRGHPGKRIDILNPDWKLLDPEQTAETLSHINRFAGNYGAYSVAQHAYLVASTIAYMDADPWQQLGALHHDDAEAITNDIPSPIKALCPMLQTIERGLNEAVNTRYKVDLDDPLIKRADQLVFAHEVSKLVPSQDRWIYAEDLGRIAAYEGDNYYTRLQISWSLLRPWTPEKAKARYMDLHEQLTKATDKLHNEQLEDITRN